MEESINGVDGGLVLDMPALLTCSLQDFKFPGLKAALVFCLRKDLNRYLISLALCRTGRKRDFQARCECRAFQAWT